MRHFKRVSKNLNAEILAVFPGILDLYEMSEINGYSKLSISVFSHWLSQNEAIDEIDEVSTYKIKKNNEKLHSFTVALIESTTCYLIKIIGLKKDTVTFRELLSPLKLNKAILPTPHLIGDKWRFVLAIPSLEIIYFEGSDFTHHIYYKDIKKIEPIYSLVKNNELHVLQ